MPYQTSTFQLPCGKRAGRVTSTGALTGTEAAEMLKLWEPGGQMFGMLTLVLAQDVDMMTSEARALLSGWKDPSTAEWFAIVITSPVVRVATKFILRVSATARLRGKVFSTEADAIRWLDERASGGAAK